MADGSVEFEIRADNSDVEAKINDTTSKLKSAAGQWENSTNEAANSSSMFSGVLQGVGQMLGGVVANAAKQAAQALKQFAIDCINAASDLAEVSNVVDTVFGESAREIYDWAQTAQSQFGLAQTAALRYASTLGALLKSSGFGMAEVKEMSTTIAGLAADMASFYNLDFDTAFEKLKSGISGETEPLKELGINLSVANLEAYALSQGLDKAYSSMSQAEQMALRYQYIMQATSDAQGDFARTSDGYANSLRRIQSSWETIKTTIGNVLMVAVEPMVSGLADILTKLTTVPEKTLFDEIASIDTSYEEKVAEIKGVAEEARTLISVLESIHTNSAVSTQQVTIDNLITALTTDLPALYQALEGMDPTTKIKALAAALSNNGQGISMEAWATALSTYDEFAGKLAEAMQSDNPTEAIHGLADELAKGSDIDVKTWEDILSTFAEKISSSNVKQVTGDITADIQKLSDTLAADTGISTANWETALSYFGTYKDRLFEALSDPKSDEKLKELAQNLAVEYPTISVDTWEQILSTLKQYIDAGDENLNVEGIINKLSRLTGAVDGASEIKLGDLLGKIEEGAGTNHSNVDAWTAILETFAGNITGFDLAMSKYNGGSSRKIKDLAKALSGIDGDQAKVEAWKELVNLLVSNASEIQEIMGWDTEQTGGWIAALTSTINDLDAGKAGAFENLMGILLGKNGEKGLGDLAVPQSVESSFNGLTGAVEGTYYASAQELEVLKRLMQLYPQLSSIININTGEVRGGIEALKDYVDEAEATSIKMAAIARLDAKRKALAEHEAGLATMEVDILVNDSRLDDAMKKAKAMRAILEGYGAEIGDNGYGQIRVLNASDLDLYGTEVEGYGFLYEMIDQYHEAEDVVTSYSEAHDELAGKIEEERAATASARAEIEYEAEALRDLTGEVENNAGATGWMARSDEDAAKALASLKSQMQEIVNYQNNVRSSIMGTISQAVDGLKELDRTTEEYKASIAGNQLMKNLNDQLAFMEEYTRLLDQARERGVSDDVLAAVADGSVESLQYLRGLATATTDEVEQINAKFEQVTAKKNQLADNLTAQRLAVDQEYQAMIDKAVEMALAMDQSQTAGAGAQATMEAVVSNIAAGRQSLEGEVAAINALIASIGTFGDFYISGVGTGIIGVGGGVKVGKAAGLYASPHALGLDYVPYDGYLAELHQGETVLTADEAAIWRNFTGADSANTQQAFDYDMMAGMISGIPSGGNVYLDGQTVGRLISQGQGDSYRRLQRSGWRG